MFDWFGRKPDYTNVVKFPEQIKVPTPYIDPPKTEETYYSIGVTSENRITLKTGYSTLTMNRKGVENLIQQLAVFRDQLEEEHNNEEEDNA
jgi:hypothetical protein